jgi:hypothetical protein
MSPTGADLRHRIEVLLNAYSDEADPQDDTDDALTAGYGYALRLDSERLQLERRITELAATAEDPGAAAELRRLWLRHRTIATELSELRALLRELRDAQAEQHHHHPA